MRVISSCCGLALLLAGACEEAQANCRREPLGTGRVQAVLDGRTLLLEDGREVRLVRH